MFPLNAGNVLWLSCTPDEADKFLKATSNDAILLGHPDNLKKHLQSILTTKNGAYLKPVMDADDAQITFLLLQGRILGLIVRPEKKESK